MNCILLLKVIFCVFTSRNTLLVLSCLIRLSLPPGRQAPFGSSALAILPFLVPRNAAHRKPSRGSTAKLMLIAFNSGYSYHMTG